MLFNLIIVCLHKFFGKTTDFFLNYKYLFLRKYYQKRCLDIGSGTGRFAKYLLDMGHKVNMLDVIDKSEFSELGLTLFDGKNIPFDDQSFETSTVMFVLHHTDDQDELIEECKRVTSKYIIIGEDVIQHNFDKVLGNIHLGTSPWSKSKNGFRTREGWLGFFERHKLQLVKSVSIPRSIYPIYPVFREIFVLKVA
ncbi:MAG: class I SAM-dependent methyltransferase [Ekhidna sp.]